ncbi:hypothetical protein ACVI1T_006021 [Rhizobium redzepovicii]
MLLPEPDSPTTQTVLPRDGKGDAVDCPDSPRAAEEMGPEVVDLDQRVAMRAPAAGGGEIGVSIHRDLQHRVIHHRGN